METGPWIRSTRAGLLLIVFLGFVHLYLLRVNMSVAMVCMVNQTALLQEIQYKTDNTTSSDELCSPLSRVDSVVYNGSVVKELDKDGDLLWSKTIQGLVLGSFYWGYDITQIPGGLLSVKFGGRRIAGSCMFICAMCTLITPVAAEIHYIFLMVVRFTAGIVQGIAMPSMLGIWAYWAPPLERSKLIGMSVAGMHFGTVITFPISGLLCDYGFAGGWPSIFYVSGISTVIWCIAWMFMAYNTPAEHPRISDAERKYIQDSLTGQATKNFNKQVKIPWKSIFTSLPCISIMVANLCAGWIVYTFLNNLPAYIREVLKFDIKKNGFISSMVYLGMWAMTILSGLFADTLRTRKIMSTILVRKINVFVGLMLPGLLCIIIGYLNCTQWITAIILLTVSISLLGCLFGAGFVVNTADLAPTFASLLFSIANTFGCISGFLSPYVVGVITVNQSQEEWRTVFFITVSITTVGSIFYLIFASGEQQDWSKVEEQCDIEIKVTNKNQLQGVSKKDIDKQLSHNLISKDSNEKQSNVLGNDSDEKQSQNLLDKENYIVL